jgi:hypothetical protein
VAENIIIHFHQADRAEVLKAVTTELAPLAYAAGPRDSDGWRYPTPEFDTLLIQSYEDLEAEYLPDEISRLKSLLGSLPSYSLVIELRRSRGDRAVNDAAKLAAALLCLFDAVVDDTYSESDNFWTLEQVMTDAAKSDGSFLDCYRTDITSRPQFCEPRGCKSRPPSNNMRTAKKLLAATEAKASRNAIALESITKIIAVVIIAVVLLLLFTSRFLR